MKLSNSKRKYLAAIFGRSTEFVISIVLIGRLLTGHVSAKLLVGTGIAIVVLAFVGTQLTPDE